MSPISYKSFLFGSRNIHWLIHRERDSSYECAILQRLMSDNWPSLRWRLKNCRVDGKPLLPKKMDDRLTVGEHLLFSFLFIIFENHPTINHSSNN